jgi:transposase
LHIAIVTWIERTYHRRRRQAALGRLTPIEYEIIMTAPLLTQPDPTNRTCHQIVQQSRANGGSVALTVEGCTGWRYVVEEIEAAGFEAHLAEPADTQAAHGRKRRAKTDRSDARLLRDLLVAGELPASRIPPEPSLVNQRTVWCQRIHAELYHHGVAVPEGAIRTVKTRAMLADDTLQLSPAGRERIAAGYRMIDATDLEALPLKRELQRFGVHQPACRALVDAQYGIDGLIAVAVWTELGDCQRFRRSEQVVRHTGLDVTVDSSDRRRAGGFLSRQGPQTLRWALYEAAKNSSHHRSPDHDYYAQVKQRHDGKIAAISVARQLARRCYHVLRTLDPDVVYAMPN